ncbi:MAG: Ppx/GppA phosphatase family protein [Chloroflexota bacterium]
MLPNQGQRIAIIDLGSNTVRMVIMRAVSGYAYRLEDEIREVVRLREGMTQAGLSQMAMARALSTLRLFKRFCDSWGVDHILPTATSAVREAANGQQFLDRIQAEIGLSLRLLSGEEEAYYATLGVLNEVPLANGFMVDIGGGSAQVAEVESHRFRRGHAFTLGALALTLRFIKSDPVSEEEITAVSYEINHQLDQLDWLQQASNKTQLVGLGGTIRNLAKMVSARQTYPLNTLHGFTLTHDDLQQNIELLQSLPLAERKKIRGLSSDRADIILPGALVLQAVMERLGAAAITISRNGLREGVFFEHFWSHLDYPIMANTRRFTVLNMARIYNYQKAHANHVRYLAGRLFNQLAPLHNYQRPERELLDAAALLHDLGTIIGYDNHHKHSQTLIINSGLPGFTPRETALIALLARYHRKGKPSVMGFGQLLQSGDKRLLLRLAAILRLAEFLERGRNAAVDDITAVWNKTTLRLTLIADHYPAVELWEAERNAADLMAQAFNRAVVLESTAAPDVWLS